MQTGKLQQQHPLPLKTADVGELNASLASKLNLECYNTTIRNIALANNVTQQSAKEDVTIKQFSNSDSITA